MRFYLESNGVNLEAAGNDHHAILKILDIQESLGLIKYASDSDNKDIAPVMGQEATKQNTT